METVSNQTTPEELWDSMPESYRAILNEVCDGEDGVRCIADMAAYARVPLNHTKKILKELRAQGLIQFGTCYMLDNENLRSGSGYWITTLGQQVKNCQKLKGLL